MTEKKDMKILVVDDEQIILDLLEEYFNVKGYKNLVFVHNGQEAFDCISKNGGIDVLLKDCKMPVMNGKRLIEEIKKLDQKKIPLIYCMSGISFCNFKHDSRCGLPNKIYLEKPIDFEKLDYLLNNAYEILNN